MLTFVLTAIATGAQVYWLLSWGIWGAPTSSWQYVSLAGSVALFVSGLLVRGRLRSLAALLAAGACLAMWSFYGPAFTHTVQSWPSETNTGSIARAFTPIILLTLSSLTAISLIVRRNKRRERED